MTPIVFIDGNREDLLLAQEMVAQMGIAYPVIAFHEPAAALLYFMDNSADARCIVLSGDQVPELVVTRQMLLERCPALSEIPFVFLSPAQTQTDAANLTDKIVWFERKNSLRGMKEALESVFAWLRVPPARSPR